MRQTLPMSILAVPLAATVALAQVAPKGTGFKAEYLAELSVAEDHLVRLAEAIPADKYTWRPATGVRSFSEVFLHIAGSNLNLPRTLGVAPKEGMARSPGEVMAAMIVRKGVCRGGTEALMPPKRGLTPA